MRIDLASHVYGFFHGRSGGNDAHVYLLFACEADACDETCAKVDHALIDSRQVGVRVEHVNHNRRIKGESRAGNSGKTPNVPRSANVSWVVLTALRDGGGSVEFPFPWSDGVAEDGFQKRAKGEFAVVAVGEEDHAGF